MLGVNNGTSAPPCPLLKYYLEKSDQQNIKLVTNNYTLTVVLVTLLSATMNKGCIGSTTLSYAAGIM